MSETPEAELLVGKPADLPPLDLGARQLVDSMLQAISSDDQPQSAAGDRLVTLSPIRNQSRGGQGEYAEFLERLAALLTDAAGNAKVRFVATDAPTAEYELQGAAYLVTRDGFDMWELYPSLTARRRMLTLWQHSGPVWVLRSPRPGQPQVLLPQ